ncbi:MAG: hypothetical protein JXL80_15990, partial [Planctomycetes bacterium]|nr:hypothetical protein [Planctomycetota bacterium]
MNRTVVVFFVFVTLVAGCAAKKAEPERLMLDHYREAQSLAGSWLIVPEHGDEEMWRLLRQAESEVPWKAVEVPGGNLLRPDDPSKPGAGKAVQELAKETACVWIRRRFNVTAERAARDAVLKWGGIRFGATAWINGTLLGHHPTVGPNTVLVPKGTLHEGGNEIVLKVLGWNGVPKSASGYPLIPVGGATQSWGGKGPAVYQDIWLEFYDRVYLRHVLAMPNVSDGTVTFRIGLDGAGKLPDTVNLNVLVYSRRDQMPLAGGGIGVKVRGNRPTAEITCRLRRPALWTPQTPFLYHASVQVNDGHTSCDEMWLRFGMRQVTVEGGHFSLNGKPLWLRGSNLVNEWLWGEKFDRNAKQYIIDEARSMNLNCFRTHTQPPTTKWLDIADRYGMMILAEFPLLYNHADFKYTPEEYEVLHANAMIDAEGWITKLWNHPSVVMWVLSNESRHDNEWESGPYYRHAKALDPTRLCMRTGEVKVGTPDIADQHTCFNVVRGAEGQLLVDMANLMADKDPDRPLTNTEYMNHMWDPSVRFLGSEKHADMPLEYAGIATEHTEAMRRLAFDCLLPYMYAGWTRLRGAMNWRDDYPTPMAAALHSSMAPVLASLDLFDSNHVSGDTLHVPIMLINETHGEVSGKLDLYITPRHPLYVPDAQALAAAVWRESQD